MPCTRDKRTSPPPVGLSTQESLTRLYDAVFDELKRFEDEQKESNKSFRKSNTWFSDAFHHRSPHTTFHWLCAVVLVLISVLLLVCYAQRDDIRYSRIPLEVIVILSLVVVNLYAVGLDNRLRHCEVLNKAKNLLQFLKGCINKCKWNASHFPHPNMPFSPCITLQWTYRDGDKVNLHCSLLVEGDIIALRPGQVVPGKCRPFKEGSNPELKFGDIFAPSQDKPQDSFCVPQMRAPLKTRDYILMETPYIQNLRLALEKSHARPLTYFTKECFIITVHYLQQIVIPALLIVLLLVNVLRYVYLWDQVGHWTEMLFIIQIEAILPLLPIMFPMCWLLLNTYGMARLAAMFSVAKQVQLPDLDLDELGEALTSHPSMDIGWSQVKGHICDILCGRDMTLCRTANLLHIFGSVTSLCCVDKKGILSWPNPTPEKVFFLKLGGNNNMESCGGLLTRDTSHDTSLGQDEGGETTQEIESEANSPLKVGSTTEIDLNYVDHQKKTFVGDLFIERDFIQESRVEVLDLTHDNQIPFRVQFDDPKWKRHINSLKPLGLAILLNTCNPDTQEYYTNFSSHIACEALTNDVVVPVINRRCLCELAHQIGFREQALGIFQLQQHLSMFRHVQPEQARRDKFSKSLQISKVRFPFPHMASVVVRELNTGMLQLMSQGTGDIILDSCSDFWDGQDLCPLSESDRKKILDFYHRTSLTSYCTAFAYRPLSTQVSDNLNDVYVEIPADSCRLYSSLWTPSSPSRSWDNQNFDGRMKMMSRCLSSDSLLGHALQDTPIDDAESCFETQCNQVFIGMVAMQYQARTDMVHMIEQLDKACIRFVHFSKENELRSRVFSEKMGLESGWNCHISLLSEKFRSECGNSAKTSRTSLVRKPLSIDDILGTGDGPKSPKTKTNLGSMRQLSYSAPSAINLEVATVKFEDEISLHDLSDNSSRTSSGGRQGSSETERKNLSKLGHPEEDLNEDITEALIDQRMGNSTDDCAHTSRSPSHVTESTEQSVPITFDMSNRAKLPKGIENIRPHLEIIDNVPLLVSLFTDCTPDTTKEMIQVMQEYGEVVCCMGSAANSSNMGVFMEADASIAVEPLYPQLCGQQPTYSASSTECPLPVEVSHCLNSLPCSVNFYRDDPVSIYHLIMEARHFTLMMCNCFNFYLSSSLSLSILIALSSILLLPPPITLSHILIFILFTIPLLSVSLVGCPLDNNIMTLATKRNTHVLTKQSFFSFVGYNGVRFLPSIGISLVCFSLMLTSFCYSMPPETQASCSILFGNINHTVPNEWGGLSDKFNYSYCVAQNVIACMLSIYFVCISASFVNQSQQIWKQSPACNRLWCVTAATIIIFQLSYCVLDIYLRSTYVTVTNPSFESVPILVWVLACCWPFLILGINEVLKRHKIKVDVRYQKRARLEFGTKLGMNSPF